MCFSLCHYFDPTFEVSLSFWIPTQRGCASFLSPSIQHVSANQLVHPCKMGSCCRLMPTCNYCLGRVSIYLFFCNLDKCGLLNLAKINEPIISGQDTRQADCFDLQGYVNKYQRHVLFFRLYASLVSGMLSMQSCEFTCCCWVVSRVVM